MFLVCAAAVGVVIRSWMAPEPESQRVNPASNPAQGYEPISFNQCAAPEVAPPSYGTRSVSTSSITECIR